VYGAGEGLPRAGRYLQRLIALSTLNTLANHIVEAWFSLLRFVFLDFSRKHICTEGICLGRAGRCFQNVQAYRLQGSIELGRVNAVAVVLHLQAKCLTIRRYRSSDALNGPRDEEQDCSQQVHHARPNESRFIAA